MNRLVLVLLVGVGFGFDVRSYADEPKKSDKHVEVLVATRNLNVHERVINPERDFVIVAFHKSAAPDDPASLDYVKGRVLRRSIRKGDCIRKSDLYPTTRQEIPGGFYAVGVPIEIKNLALPARQLAGNRVDIVLHVKNDKGMKTYTVLKDTLVVVANDLDGESKDIEIITFALKEQDAFKLTIAKDVGKLQVVIPERVEIIIANRDLAVGEVLDQPTKQFAKKSIRKDETPKGAILGLDDLKGRTLKRPIREGAAVTKEDLLGRDEKSELAIPDGHRDYALRIDTHGIRGLWSLPGARVSLVYTTKKKGETVSRVIVEDVLALAVDEEPVAEGKLHIVTFAVTPETAARLEALRDSGTFSIVLRRPK